MSECPGNTVYVWAGRSGKIKCNLPKSFRVARVAWLIPVPQGRHQFSETNFNIVKISHNLGGISGVVWRLSHREGKHCLIP